MTKNKKPEPYVGVLDLKVLTSMPGLTYLKGIISGKYPIPPIMHNLKYIITEADEGRVVVEGYPNSDFLNPLGVVHGGWIATVLDTAMACSVQSVTAIGEATTTIEFKLNCVRPVTKATGTVIATSEVIQRGRRIATARATMTDASGNILAHSTETCMIFSAE